MGSSACLRATDRTRAARKILVVQLLVSTAMVGSVGIPDALAQAAPPAVSQPPAEASQARTFNIPAQSLASALRAFGRQSGLQVTLASTTSQGVTSQAVNGRYAPEQALALLLAGTDISYRITPDRTAIVGGGGAGSSEAATVEGAIALDTIDVSGGGAAGLDPDEPYRTPGSTSVITAEQINRVPPTSAGDMFREAPGVLSVSNHNGTAVDVNIRGQSGMNRVKVMVDGTQQQVNTYRGYAGPDNRSYVDPDFVAGIVVEKGSVSGPYGSGVTGGVVNMTTIGVDDILLPGQDQGVRIKGSTGSNTTSPRYTPPPTASRPDRLPEFTSPGVPNQDRPDFLTDATRSGSFVAAARADNVEVLAGYSRHISGNYFAGTKGDRNFTVLRRSGSSFVAQDRIYAEDFARGAEVVNTSEDTESILLKGTVRWDDGQSLELGFNQYDSHSGVIFPSSTWMYPNIQFPLSDVLSRRYHAKYRLAPEGNDLIDLTANVWGTTFASTDPHENDIGYRSKIDSASYGSEIWNKSVIATGFGDLRLTYGGEYAFADYDNYTLYPPRESLLYPTTPGWPLFHLNGGERTVWGLHAGASFDATSWLTLDASVRYDSYKSGGAAYLSSIDFDTFQEVWSDQRGEVSGSGFSPKVGITLKPIDGLQVFATYGRGLRPPSLVETVGSGSVARIIPNPNLDPERSEDFELGFNVLRNGILHGDDKFKFKAAYYHTDVDDYIARSSVPLIHPVYGFLGLVDYQYNNIAKARIRGIELSASYDAGTYFIDGNLNYLTSVKYCFDDTQVPINYGTGINGCTAFTYPGDWRGSYVQPKYAGMLTAGVRLLDQALTLGGSVQVFGESVVPRTVLNSLAEPVFWDAAVIANAFAGYKFNDNLNVNLSVENLFDRFYVSPMAVAEIPSPGRTVRVGFTARF